MVANIEPTSTTTPYPLGYKCNCEMIHGRMKLSKNGKERQLLFNNGLCNFNMSLTKFLFVLTLCLISHQQVYLPYRSVTLAPCLLKLLCLLWLPIVYHDLRPLFSVAQSSIHSYSTIPTYSSLQQLLCSLVCITYLACLYYCLFCLPIAV